MLQISLEVLLYPHPTNFDVSCFGTQIAFFFFLTMGHFPCLFAHGSFKKNFIACHALLLFSCVLDIFVFLYVFLSLVWNTVKWPRSSLSLSGHAFTHFLRGNWGYVYSRGNHSPLWSKTLPKALWFVRCAFWLEGRDSAQSCVDAVYSSLWSCQGVLSRSW